MKKDEILSYIYTSPNIIASAKRITKGDDLYNDLISELILTLSALEESFLNDLNDRKKLMGYCWRIMYCQFTNPNLDFYRKYRNPESYSVDNIENIDLGGANVDEAYKEVSDIINSIEKKVARKRYPTEVRLLELYVKLGSYRAVAKETRVSHVTIGYMIQGIVKKIRQEYDITYNGKKNNGTSIP